MFGSADGEAATVALLMIGLCSCTRADPPPPPPAPPLTPDAKVPVPVIVDAVVDAVIDAVIDASPQRAQKFIRIGDCPDGGYGVDWNCADWLTAPGLPALDASRAKIALPILDEAGLQTLPNLTIDVVSSSDGRKLSTMPVMSQDKAHAMAKVMQDDHTPQMMQKAKTTFEAAAVDAEKQLTAGGYQRLIECTATTNDPPETPDDHVSGRMTCGSNVEQWTCGDIEIDYTHKEHAQLKLKGAKTKTIATTAWRQKPVPIFEGGGKQVSTAPTWNCIHSAWRIPGTAKIAIELRHVCDVSGDWCWVGKSTWHLVD